MGTNGSALGRCRIAWLAVCALFPASGGIASDVPVAWQLLDDGDPDPQAGVVVYDTVRQRKVLLTHGGGWMPSITWELVGEDWVRRFLPEPTPWYVHGACGAFDQSRGVTVIFGGFGTLDGSSTYYSDETWEYDGTSWTRRFPADHPSARLHCGAVFDSVRNKIVLFGGYSSGFTGVGETWEYDGVNWNQVTTTSTPGPRGDPGLAFDAARGVAVLFGGRNGSNVLIDTWEYDGRKWRLKSPSSSPSPRGGSGMAYDPVRQRTVLFGGHTPFQVFGDTWEWNGTNWTSINVTTLPEPRLRFRMVWDPVRGRVIGQGGQTDNGSYNSTWSFNGADWTRVADTQLPPGRTSFAMGYDPVADRVVAYGGIGQGPVDYLADTWAYQDGLWSALPGAGTPTANYGFQLAFDAEAGALRGFSGYGTGTLSVVDDLHQFGGTPPAWTSSVGAGPWPDPRTRHGWIHNPALGGNFLFGGLACCFSGASYAADDTWLNQGSGWTPITPPTRPAGRYTHGLAFDSARGRAVLYGGLLQSGYTFADTWTFDGTTWTLMQNPSPPGPRQYVALAYDVSRDRTVLFGDGRPSDLVTWEFDGSGWLARSTPFRPDPSRFSTGLVYDSRREVVLLFSGRARYDLTYFNDTWAYGADPDQDGVVGGLDNCRTTANPDQSNVDGDPAGDVCDCAPTDGGAFAVPPEVSGLSFGSDKATLTWTSVAAASGSGTVYDVPRGNVGEFPVGSGPSTCVASGAAITSASDSSVPALGVGWWYLVRGRNVCGAGPYGSQSDGTPRAVGVCP